jgi:hypothetical protein
MSVKTSNHEKQEGTFVWFAKPVAAVLVACIRHHSLSQGACAATTTIAWIVGAWLPVAYKHASNA